MDRRLQVYQTDEYDMVAKLNPTLLLGPLAAAGALAGLAYEVDVPLLTAHGNAVDNSGINKYLMYSYQTFPVDKSNAWKVQPVTATNIDGPYVGRANLTVTNLQDSAEIIRAIVNGTKTEVQQNPGHLKLTALAYDPADSSFDLAAMPPIVTTAANNAPELQYYKVTAGNNLTTDSTVLAQKVTDGLTQTAAWGNNQQATISYKGDMVVPYTYKQHLAIENFALQNGFLDVGALNRFMQQDGNEALRQQAEAVLRSGATWLSGPSVLVQVENDKPGMTPIQLIVCQANTTMATNQYQVLKAEQSADPTVLAALTVVATGAILASRLRRQRRVIDGIQAPTSEKVQAAKAGTAPVMDKLEVYAYQEALKKQPSAEHSVKNAIKRLIGPFALLAGLGVAGGAVYSVPTYLGGRHSLTPAEAVVPARQSDACPADMPFAVLSDGYKGVKKQVYIDKKDVSVVQKKIPVGK